MFDCFVHSHNHGGDCWGFIVVDGVTIGDYQFFSTDYKLSTFFY